MGNWSSGFGQMRSWGDEVGMSGEGPLEEAVRAARRLGPHETARHRLVGLCWTGALPGRFAGGWHRDQWCRLTRLQLHLLDGEQVAIAHRVQCACGWAPAAEVVAISSIGAIFVCTDRTARDAHRLNRRFCYRWLRWSLMLIPAEGVIVRRHWGSVVIITRNAVPSREIICARALFNVGGLWSWFRILDIVNEKKWINYSILDKINIYCEYIK